MKHLKDYPISIAETFRAHRLIQSYLRPTSLTHHPGLSAALGAEIYVKHENHNPTGTFKIRGGLLHPQPRRGDGGIDHRVRLQNSRATARQESGVADERG